MNPANAMQAIINYVTNPANILAIGSDPVSGLTHILTIIQGVVPPIVSSKPPIDGGDGSNGGSGIGGLGTAASSVVSEVIEEAVGVGVAN